MLWRWMAEFIPRTFFILGKPIGVSCESMEGLKSSSSMHLTNVEAACWAVPSLVISDSPLNNRPAIRRAGGEKLEVTHSESMTHALNRLCCGKNTGLSRVKRTSTSIYTYSAEVNDFARDIFYLLLVFFCSGQSKALNTDAIKPVWETFSSCGRRRALEIGLSIRNASTSFCRARRSTSVWAYYWTAISYNGSETLVSPRLRAAGASFLVLSEIYLLQDCRTTASASLQTLPFSSTILDRFYASTGTPSFGFKMYGRTKYMFMPSTFKNIFPKIAKHIHVLWIEDILIAVLKALLAMDSLQKAA